MREEEAFIAELEVFRTEENLAQQYFFSWLQIRSEFGTKKELLDRINDTPLFWITAHHALLLATFVALGRVFDQRSRHNVDRLLKMASDHRAIFSQEALKRRRIAEGMDPAFAAEYVIDKHDATAIDFRALRSEVAKRRKIHERNFRDVRDKIFAHREVSTTAEANRLLAKAKIAELEETIAFLHGLYDTLWELLVNGRRPILRIPKFQLPPKNGRDAPAEVVARDVSEFFESFMSRGQRRKPR